MSGSQSHPPTSMAGMSDTLESLDHLQSIGRKLETLERAGYEAADQIAQQLLREQANWCACRIVAALSDVIADHQNYIARRLQRADFDHLTQQAKPCACEDLWITGAFPVEARLPTRPGVYVCFDEFDRAAYIGTSRNNVRGRLQAHFRDPNKPTLSRWGAFFPGQFGESAAVWEVRLIEEHKPYLNREHVHDDDQEVAWEPQGYRGSDEPWYFRDADYLWFLDGPGRLIDQTDSEHWQTAKAIRNLIEYGATRDDIEEACRITSLREPDSPVGYMAGVARNLARERIEDGGT